MKNIFHKFSGFILIEMIMAIVLLGVIGIFTSMFLYTGIKGYLIAKQTTDGAMRAQIALDRINLELRKITDLPSPGPKLQTFPALARILNPTRLPIPPMICPAPEKSYMIQMPIPSRSK
jgi:hypothetical protein